MSAPVPSCELKRSRIRHPAIFVDLKTPTHAKLYRKFDEGIFKVKDT